MGAVCDPGRASQQSQAALCCQLCMQEQPREGGFVSNNDITDRLHQGQQQEPLRPSVHDGTEPLSLPLAPSLVSNLAPKAFWGAIPARSRLFHPWRLSWVLTDLAESWSLLERCEASPEPPQCSCGALPGPKPAAAAVEL